MSTTPPARPLERRPATWAVITFCFLLFAARVIHVAWTSSPTFDEPKHIMTGLAYLARGWCCLGRDNTPLAALYALPLYPAGEMPLITARDSKPVRAGGDPAEILRPRYFKARLTQLPFAFLLLAAAFFWIARSFGFRAGALATLFVCLEPNLVAFASLASPDFQVTALVFAAAVVAAPMASGRITWRRTAGLGVLCGLALLAKYSALFLAPALLLLLACLRQWRGLGHAMAAFAIAALLVVLAYEVPPLTRGLAKVVEPEFDHPAFKQMLDMDPGKGVGFFAGLKIVRESAKTGFPVYFFGALDQSFALFYPSVLLFKMPLVWLALAPIGLVYWLRSRARRRDASSVLIVAAVLMAAAMASRFNLGLRHILLVSPVLSCLAAVGLCLAPGRAPAKLALAAIAMLSALRYHPHELSYFNELLGPERASRVLVDSSLDWGQDLWKIVPAQRALGIETLTGYLHVPMSAAQLGVFVEAPKEIPPRGWCAVSISKLRGLGRQDYETYRVDEFFERLAPVARLGYSTYLYLVPAPRP